MSAASLALSPELWIGAFGLLVLALATLGAAARVALRLLYRRRRRVWRQIDQELRGSVGASVVAEETVMRPERSRGQVRHDGPTELRESPGVRATREQIERLKRELMRPSGRGGDDAS